MFFDGEKRGLVALNLAIILGLVLFLTQFALAQQINVVINGKVLDNASAVIINGRVLVPCRAVGDALACDISWNNNTKTVTLKRDKTILQLAANSTTAYLNSKTITLDVPSIIIDNRLYLPLRLVAESLGAKVLWEAPKSTVAIIDTHCPVCIK